MLFFQAGGPKTTKLPPTANPSKATLDLVPKAKTKGCIVCQDPRHGVGFGHACRECGGDVCFNKFQPDKCCATEQPCTDSDSIRSVLCYTCAPPPQPINEKEFTADDMPVTHKHLTELGFSAKSNTSTEQTRCKYHIL